MASKNAADPSRIAAPLVLALIVIANIGELAPISNLVCFAVSVFLLASTVYLRAWAALPAVLVYTYIYLYWIAMPKWAYVIPSVPFILPSLLTWLTLRRMKNEESHLRWLTQGQIDKMTVAWITVTAFASTAALITWANWTSNLGIGTQMAQSVQGVPSWVLLGVIIPAFAIINAVGEEIVVRGYVQESLQKSLQKVWLVIGFQASAFAAFHYNAGFPNGTVGYAMTFAYACMLGYLRHRTRGILAPILAHIAADLCIGYFLILNAV